MLQPFEGIPTVSRDQDDLLSLEDTAMPRRAMMIALVKHLRRATQVGNPAPIVQRMGERLRKPEVGDLVVEVSRAIYGQDPDTQLKGFGILIERRQEWWQTDAEREADLAEERKHDPDYEEGPRAIDEAWYVLYGPNPEAVCRWTNCDFMTVPIDPGVFDVPIGTRTENGVELTRNDILTDLADSGFTLRATPPDA